MKRHLKLIALGVVCAMVTPLGAQITLVKKQKPVARICVVGDKEPEKQAATLLQDFVQRISKAQLPIVEGASEFRKGDIVIGEPDAKVGEDGFSLTTADNRLYIRTGGDKGSIYGVVTLLEKWLGVSYYAKDVCHFTPMESIELPALAHSETPAFRYRQTFSYGNEDPIYRMWFRLEEPNEMFIDNLWVHTFNRILPSDVYGKEHPEYYSFINGEHRPGHNSQWCLTNPEVFDAAVKSLDSIFKAHPDLKMISVSQNDGNNTNCSCPECKAVDEYEGSPSGNLIRFLNKLAERFPDKEFSTLAYLYSMQPPKHTKPHPNVNIMLCDIDCKREVPLTDNESGQYFVKALEGWSAISNNIFVWHYGINFDNIVSPFPNFHILQKNIQLFKKNHATMHFSQVNGIRGGDFSEMRAYMIGKLMWNPDLDADSLMQTFMNGYYGEAAPYLYQYQKIMQGALLASGQPLWIYDSPISHKKGMLNPHLIKTYDELFDKAEEVVKDNRTLLERVQLSRLPLQYSKLEIARTEADSDKEDSRRQLDLFEQRTAQFGVKSLNERNNPPAEYCVLYRKRFLPQNEKSKAAGATVEWISKPESRYQPIADKALTDELYGGTTYVESWVGWEGRDAEFILDMGEEKEFSRIETDFLHQLGAWVLLPKSVTYSVSSDKEMFTPFGDTFEFAEDRDLQVKFVPGKVEVAAPVKARYIKVQVKTIGLCPSWHYGVGYPAWYFMDEVAVF